MEVWKIKLFSHVCVLFAALDCLQLNVDEQISLIEECVAVALFLEDIVTQRISYRLLGALYQQIYQMRKAAEYYKKQLHIAKKMGDINEEFAAYENLGLAYYLLGDFHEATKHHEKCLSIAKESGNIREEGVAYGNLGNDYQALGKYHQAVEHHEKCLHIAVKIRDRKLEELAYSHLGNAYQSLGKYQNAIEYQEKLLGIAIELSDREGEAGAYSNLGNIYQLLGSYQKAIEYQEKSLGIALKMGDRKGEGSAYGNLGLAYTSLGHYQKAHEYHEKCLSIAVEIEDKLAEGNTYGNLGNIYQLQGEYEEAIKFLKKRLRIATAMGDRKGEASVYASLGNAFRLLGKYQKSLEYSDKSLSIGMEIEDKRLQESGYANIGSTYLSQGKYQEARDYNEKALKIAKEIGDRDGEGSVYGNIGSIYRLSGKYPEALEYHKKSLSIAIDIGDREGESVAHGNLGYVCFLMGKYQKAIEYLEKSLVVAKELNDKRGEGACYGKLGSYFQAFGKYSEAKRYYEQQLNIAREIGDRAGEGEAYGSIGTIYQLFGEYQKAIDYLEKSLSITAEIGDRNGEGVGYWCLGVVYRSMGKYEEAIEYQNKCLDIAKEIGNRRQEGAANGSIGNAYHSLKKYQVAIEYYKKYLSIAEELDDRDGQGQAHFHIGSSYSSLALQQDSNQPANMKEAENHFKKSIKSFESLFDDLEQDQYKILIVDTYIEAYRRLAFTYLQAERKEEALLVSDRGRARALGDLLSSKYSMNKEFPSKTVSVEATDIEMILSTCNFGILYYAVERGDSGTHIWVLAHQSPLFFHHCEMERFKSSIKPFSLLEDSSEEIEKKSILNLVKKSYDKMEARKGVKCEDRSLGLIEGEEQDIEKESISVSSQVAEPIENTTKGKEIAKEVNVPDSRCIYDGDHEDDEKPLELLYDALIAPVQHKLVQDEIVIIPDGALFMVPFAAFQDPKTGQFLSETKRIRLAPSLMTLKVLKESSDDHHLKSGALIVGNPEIGNVKYKGSERSFTNLPGAEKEAEEIAKLLGVKPLTGRQATKEAVVKKLQVGVSVIHFAAHGSENGQIFLAPSASLGTNHIPNEQHYILTVKEAQESGIQAQLVVLSCCHSGRGEIKAEGVVGMARAFLAAGARAVVASLWAIDDDATKVFMLKFYSHLKQGESAGMSLQQAMKEMRETETYKEPKYWAAFFLIGDDVTISV